MVTPVDVADTPGPPVQATSAGFFTPIRATVAPGPVSPAFPTEEVLLNEVPAVQYDLMSDLVDIDMFKVYSDMLWSESLRIQPDKSPKC